jgi:hypothetical protein
MQKYSDDNHSGPGRRSHTCSEHGEVASIAGKLNIIAGLFATLLSLVGYNIHTTQQIQVRVAEQVATLGGELSSANVRAHAIEDIVRGNSGMIKDLDQRVRYIENRENGRKD